MNSTLLNVLQSKLNGTLFQSENLFQSFLTPPRETVFSPQRLAIAC